MAPTYQSLAGIARMPYPGASTTRTTTTTTTTATTTTVKPKLTLDNLTNYLAQLEQTPITPRSDAEEPPSSTIAECGEATTLAWDYNSSGSDLSAAPAARVDRIFNGQQKWKNSIKEEDADEERGLGVKDADSGSGSCSSSTPTSSAPRGTYNNNNKESNNKTTTPNHDTTTTTTTTSKPPPSSPEKQNHEKPQERAPETGRDNKWWWLTRSSMTAPPSSRNPRYLRLHYRSEQHLALKQHMSGGGG